VSYGDRWKQAPASFWNDMAARSKGTRATEELLALASAKRSVVEVGCGAGHLAAQLFQSGFEGTYFGCDIGPSAIDAAVARARALPTGSKDRAVFAVGDFFDLVREERVPSAELVISRDAVQHHSHWLPLVVTGLRVAPAVALAITRSVFLTEDGHHRVLDKGEFFDTTYSLPLLEREAAAAGLGAVVYRTRGPHGAEAAIVFWTRRT
jgi:SAM-dependent methyltransferase